MTNSPYQYLVKIGFAATGTLGLLVLIGWRMELPLLYRVSEGLAPMQFNNALCFLLLGLSGILTACKKPLAAICISVVGITMAFTTWLQYPLNRNFGIDLLLFNTQEIVPTSNPGRMAPNSALTHVAAFLALILINQGQILSVRIASVLSAIILSSGLISVIGYLIGSEKMFSWGHLTQMAVNTSIGFILAGASMILVIIPQLKTWVEEKSIARFYFWPYLCVFAIAVFLIDMQMPQSVAMGLLYSIVVMSAWFSNFKNSMLVTAAICTVLIILDSILSTEASQIPWLYTRGVAVLSVWTAAFVFHYLRLKSEKLAESEERFRSVFETSGEGILVVDKDMTITMVNSRLNQMFGYTDDELVGQKLEKLIPERYRRDHFEHTSGFAHEGLGTREMGAGKDLFALKKDGSEFPVEIGLSTFYHDDSRFTSANISDISERIATRLELENSIQRLREIEIRFKSIFNNTYQFIGLLRPDGTLVEANQTALDFAGTTMNDIVGKKFWDTPWWAHSKDVQEQMKAAIKQAASGEFVRYDVENLGADGTRLTVDFSLRPITNEEGEVIYLVPEGRDITDRNDLEVKLRTNQKLLQQFVKHTPNAVAMFNTSLEYIVASDAWYRDYGIEGKDIIGVHHYEVFPEIKNLPEWQERHQRALRGETIRSERDSFVREDGSTSWLRYVIQPWMNERDEIGGIIMFTEVITARVELERNLENSEKRFNLAVQGTTAGIWDWVDVNNDKEWWSPRFYQLLGYEPDEIEPSVTTFSSLLHPDDQEMTFKMVDRHFKRRTPFLVEYRLRTKSGKYRWFLGSGQATWDESGVPVRMVGTIIDIHSRKMAEEAEIQHARDLAEKNKELEEFTYVASHDLQEPVRTISSFVELFRETYSEKLDDEALKWLDFMQGASERSQKLIIDLLEYSRIGKARELGCIDVNKLLRNIETDLQASIKKNKARIVYENLPVIDGYETELRLLFQNLIGNGIKFKKPNENPIITIAHTNVDGFHHFTVSDNGIGIEQKYFDKVFVIFRRLHGKSEYEGTGIGLAHCKKVVDLHHGKIWITSTVGHGTSFHFTIPEDLGKTERTPDRTPYQPSKTSP